MECICRHALVGAVYDVIVRVAGFDAGRRPSTDSRLARAAEQPREPIDPELLLQASGPALASKLCDVPGAGNFLTFCPAENPAVPRIEPTICRSTRSGTRAGCEAQALCRP